MSNPLTPETAMTTALDVAAGNIGQTWPNPCVGCTIIGPDGTIVAQSATHKGGRPHAETQALEQAGEMARGGTAYVTLEPCAHTSPAKPVSCADALVASGIKKLVAALPDPDARVSGQGFQKLMAAGIEVECGLLAPEAFDSLKGHMARVLMRRPFITLKLARSRDGKMGVPDKRITITGPQAWERVYALRGRVDGVMVGINTALADDPQLTDRRANATHQPVRIVADTHGRLPLTGKLAQTAKQIPVWLLGSTQTPALESAGIRLLHANKDEQIKTLYEAGLSHILVEGGAKLANTLLHAGLVDELVVIDGNIEIGEGGIPCPAIPANRFTLETSEQLGPDTWQTYTSNAWIDARAKIYEAARTFTS